jgi:hypothetical protein
MSSKHVQILLFLVYTSFAYLFQYARFLWSSFLPHSPSGILPRSSMPTNGSGTLSYRSTKVVDTRIGFDGQDPSDSQLTGDRAILISNDGERQTERLDNITHKRRRVALNPDALDDALAKWVPVNVDSGHLLDLSKMDSISGASTSVDPGKKRKSYKSSVCNYSHPSQFY